MMEGMDGKGLNGPDRAPQPEALTRGPGPVGPEVGPGNAGRVADVAKGIAPIGPGAGNAAQLPGIQVAPTPEALSPAGKAPAPTGIGPSPTAGPAPSNAGEQAPTNSPMGAAPANAGQQAPTNAPTGAAPANAGEQQVTSAPERAAPANTAPETTDPLAIVGTALGKAGKIPSAVNKKSGQIAGQGSILNGFGDRDGAPAGAEKRIADVAGNANTKLATTALGAAGNAVKTAKAVGTLTDGQIGLEDAAAVGDVANSVKDVTDLAGSAIGSKAGRKLTGMSADAASSAAGKLGKVGAAAGKVGKVGGAVGKVDKLMDPNATGEDKARAGLGLAGDVKDGVNTVVKHVDKSSLTKSVAAELTAKGMKGPKVQAVAKAAAEKAGSSKSAIKAAASAAGAGKHANVAKHAAASAAKSTSLAAKAGKASSKVIGKTATKVIGTAAGAAAKRFTPGLNVAMAAVDTYSAYKDIKGAINGEEGASVGKAVTSGVRALGSIAAATNIPVVSQVGAGISAIADFALSFW